MKLNDIEFNEYTNLKRYAKNFNNAVDKILLLSVAFNKTYKRTTYIINVKALTDLKGTKYYYLIDKRSGDYNYIKSFILDYAEMIRTALLKRISNNNEVAING